MIDFFHWLACWIVLSVSVTHLESIKATHFRVCIRATGWALIGLAAFGGIVSPFVPGKWPSDGLGMIGIAILAISYRWQGATSHVRQR